MNAAPQSLQRHFHKIARFERSDARGNFVSHAQERWPVVGGQNQNRQFSPGDVLLVFEVLIAGEKGVELRFSSLKQRAVFQLSPAHLLCGVDSVIGKKLAQRTRDASIQQHFHAA